LYEQRLRFQAVKNMLPLPLPAQCWMTSLGGMTSPILLPGRAPNLSSTAWCKVNGKEQRQRT
jgi:hypothetical protein